MRIMAIANLKKRAELDRLITNLSFKLGKKISPQDVLDACIEISTIHIDELESFFSELPRISEKRVMEILEMADDFEYDISKNIDQDIYGGK